uniref:BLTX668 n=1 Tax=Nephila pilipes TaxID=299642 RepID=A0A076L085_NEPPI|nr:BLTX668 [Nephila pilipes]
MSNRCFLNANALCAP